MGTLCLSKEYKSPPPKIRTSLVESVVGSHRMKVNAPRQGRIEKKLCKLKRIGIVPVEISVICILTQFSIVWTFGFNCPIGVKIPTVIKIGTFSEPEPVVKCWVSINPRLKFIQIFTNHNVTHAGIRMDIFLDVVRTGHSAISKLCIQISQSFPPNQNGQNVYMLSYTLNFHLFNMGHLEAVLLLILKSLREVVEYFQAMTFIAPWLSLTKVLILRHVDNAPLHRINAVVWNGFNG